MNRNQALGIGMGAALLLADTVSGDARAACSSDAPPSGTAVTCTGSTLTPVRAQPGSTGVTVDIAADASGRFTHAANPVAFSVEQNSAVSNAGAFALAGSGGTGTVRGAVLLGTGNGNQLTNAASGAIDTTGAFNDAMAANGSGNTLTNLGEISTTGPNAYGMTAAWGQTNVGQLNNTLLNAGTVSTSGSNARAASIVGGSGTIDNRGTLATSGTQGTTAYLQGNNDHLINTGSIEASGPGADAVFSNTAGAAFTALIENRAGGRIVSQGAAGIRTLNGNTTVINAGFIESVAGTAIAMGGGNDMLILQTGSTIVGDANGGAGINTVTLQGSGTASNSFTNFQTLLMQGVLWNWTGSGTFASAHVQSGTLALSGTLGAPALVVATIDANATLQANAQNLPRTVTDNGLVRFQQDADGTYDGSIAGSGALTKAGSGMLLMTNLSTYSGTTTIAAGTLALGDATHANAALAGNGGVTVAAGATLGGYGTVSGPVVNGGTLAVANALPAFSGETNGSFTVNGALTNAALVQAGGNGTLPGNVLRVVGAYVGQSGTLALNTTLGADGAASDRLVIDGGSARGLTALRIANVGGAGAQTAANGIQVIEAANGATSDPSAFRLAAPVKAGAYVYYLAQGGVTAGTSNDWFLRNTVAPLPAAPSVPQAPGDAPPSVAPPSVAPPGVPLPGAPPPGVPPPGVPLPGVPLPAAGTPPLPAAPPAGAAALPLYRTEVPVYAAAPGVARHLGLLQIDTFHDRHGDQTLLTGHGALPAGWGRAWGGRSVLNQDGAANPEFDGSFYGVQAGHDLYADADASGAHNHYGILIGFARATCDVSGFALGTPNLDAGHVAINAYSVGGYWTHVGTGGWYTDALLMGSSLSIDPQSRDGIGATTHGTAVNASLEGGMPVALSSRVSLEPQAQLIWQHLTIDEFNDGVSNVTFNSGDTFVARLGVRLQGRFETAGATLEPYLRASVLRAFGSDDRATFANSTVIGSKVGQTAAQFGAGVAARIGKSASLFATASWLTNLGGSHQRAIGGDAGLRWTW